MAASAKLEWTFFTNHTHVLVCLAQNPEQPLRVVAQTIGITERAVQRMVQDLEKAGVLERHKVGRQNQYRLNLNVPLRHPLEKHRTIGDVLSPLLNETES